MSPTLASIVAQHPFPDFQKWWPLGEPFLAMMADAILGQWRPLAPSSDDLAAVQSNRRRVHPTRLQSRSQTRSGRQFRRSN